MSYYLMPAIVSESIRCETFWDIWQYFERFSCFFLRLLTHEKVRWHWTKSWSWNYLWNILPESVKCKKTLSFIHMKFRRVTKKRIRLKPFVSDMREKVIIVISETWLTHDDDLILWNVASSNHELFLFFDRSGNNEKRRVAVQCFLFFVDECKNKRTDLNVFDKYNFMSSWVKCRCNVSINFLSKCFWN